jgi:phosphotransferase system HPr (HPr) family protein
MPKGVPDMNEPLRRVVTIANPQGLHIRPAAAFAELAQRFEAKVTVSREGQSVDGKFWPDLLLLAAEQGTQLLLEVEGPDAAEAVEPLADQLAAILEESSAAAPPQG